MKYRIFIDTNPIWDDNGHFDTIFNSSFTDLTEFIKKHSLDNVSICIPEIVIMERIQQRTESIHAAIEYVNNKRKSLAEAGHNEKEIKPRKDYKTQFKKKAKEICEKNNVEIIKPPRVSIKKMTNLALERKKPFNDHGSGFKDTLIYLSMVEDAKKSDSDTYILCTNNNKQFDEELAESFKNEIEKDLIILPDIVAVKEKLDDLISMGLNLEERNEEVKKVTLNNLGEIMKSINRYDGNKEIETSSFLNFRTMSISDTYKLPNNEDKSKIAGYNFNDINFSVIEEVGQNNVEVNCNITCDISYKDEGRKKHSVMTASSYKIEDYNSDGFTGFIYNPHIAYGKTFRPTKKTFNLKINCNLENKNILILYINEGLVY